MNAQVAKYPEAQRGLGLVTVGLAAAGITFPFIHFAIIITIASHQLQFHSKQQTANSNACWHNLKIKQETGSFSHQILLLQSYETSFSYKIIVASYIIRNLCLHSTRQKPNLSAMGPPKTVWGQVHRATWQHKRNKSETRLPLLAYIRCQTRKFAHKWPLDGSHHVFSLMASSIVLILSFNIFHCICKYQQEWIACCFS